MVSYSGPKRHFVFLIQRPFDASDEIKPRDKPKGCWFIPLNYTTKSQSRSADIPISTWSTCQEPLIMDIDVSQDDWILFDLDVIGRVNYDESNWNLIQKALVNKSDLNVFDALTRARLTSDMFALAQTGELSYKIVLDAMKYLSMEVNSEILKLALSQFDRIYSLLIGTNLSKSFQKYVQKVLEPVFNREEFVNLSEYDPVTNVDFKSRIIESSCKFGVESCIQQSWKIIKEWKKGNGKSLSLPKTVHDTVHCTAIKYGDQKHWDFMWNLSKQSKGERRIDILMALTCSTDTTLLKRFLNWSINKEMISPHESVSIFQSLSSNRKGYNIMKKFFMSNYDKIYEL